MATIFDRLSAKIVFLRLLNDIPEQPSINRPQWGATTADIDVKNVNRTFSLKDEFCITQQLAFLCAYSDDPVHTVAICIEEIDQVNGLIVRFAANSGKHEVLSSGLDQMARILEDEARDVNRSTNYEALFGVVVGMNYWRILTRLRSRHMTSRKSERKSSLLQRLETAVQRLQSSSHIPPRITGLIEDINKLQQLFDKLEAMETAEIQARAAEAYLVTIAQKVYFIFSYYEAELRSIPAKKKVWSGNSTEALIDRMKKISQYVVACHELLKAARKYCKLFHNVRVVFLDLQQSARPWETGHDMAEVCQTTCSPEVVSRIPQTRGKSPNLTLQTMEARMRTMTSWLHAELQLLLFYEANPVPHPPRVLCASKSACFLCNLFLRLHGQFFIPNCHGKLYDGWIWPGLSNGDGLQGLLPAFAHNLDARIVENLDMARIGRRNEPLESTVSLISTISL